MSPEQWMAAAAGLQAVATVVLVVVTAMYVRRAERQAAAAERSAQADREKIRWQRSQMFGEGGAPPFMKARCEYCREQIQTQATVCPHCHREQPEG